MEKWGICTPHDIINKVHPEDAEKFQKTFYFQNIVRLVGEEGGYIKINYAEHIFRVKPELLHEIAKPKFSVGEKVIVESQGERKQAVILDDNWHFKQAEHFYFVSVNGKKRTRRYFEREIEKVEGI